MGRFDGRCEKGLRVQRAGFMGCVLLLEWVMLFTGLSALPQRVLGFG